MPMGYCLLANIAIAVEAALAGKLAGRVAVIDWDVHHGNGTETIFYERSDVLTISLHQEQLSTRLWRRRSARQGRRRGLQHQCAPPPRKWS